VGGVAGTCILRAPWREPVAALSAFAEEPWALCLLSDGVRGRWSYLARAPEAVLTVGPDDPRDAFAALAALIGPAREADPDGPPARHEGAVAKVTARIAAGEIFQANIARRWRGALVDGAAPFDLFARLAAQSPAPFASYLRLPGWAVVSNSPERFVSLSAGGV